MFFCFRYLPGRWAWLLGLGLLAPPGRAAAQPTRAGADTAATASAVRPAAPPDTAALLRKLCVAQRRGTRERLVGAGVGILFFNYLLAFNKQETTLQRVAGGIAAGELGVSAYSLGAALVQARRYRPAREKALLAALAQGQPLPRRIRRKLVAEYLKPKPTTPASPHD